MQYVFGTGLLFAQPEGADTGASTPLQVGALRGVSVDLGFNANDLHGGPWPLAVGRGTGKVSCRAEYAQLTAEGFNLLFFGGPTPTAGSTRIAVEEAHTVTGNAVAPVHAGNFRLDLGVVAALPAGDAFQRVTTAPGPRQYTCNESTGAYGFGGSNGEAVRVSYAYADASNGRTIGLPNRNIGHTPRFSAVLTETFNGKSMTLTLNSCSASRLGFTSKMEDFTAPAFSFSAAADDAGIVGSLSVEEGAPQGTVVRVVNVNAATNAGSYGVGIHVTGFNPSDLLALTLPPGRTFTGWSAWPSDTATTPTPVPPPGQYWGNGFRVTGFTPGTSSWAFGSSDGYPDGEAARAAFPGETVSGCSEYYFWIDDTNPSDNRGGVSILITRL